MATGGHVEAHLSGIVRKGLYGRLVGQRHTRRISGEKSGIRRVVYEVLLLNPSVGVFQADDVVFAQIDA